MSQNRDQHTTGSDPGADLTRRGLRLRVPFRALWVSPTGSAPRRARVWKRVTLPGWRIENAYFLLVVLAPMAVAWRGQLGWAEHIAHWKRPFSFVVPLSLEGGAAMCALWAQQAILAGDSALVLRLSTWAYAGAASYMNWWHSRHIEHEPAPAARFVAGCSLSGVYLWDRRLRRRHRESLHAKGLVDHQLPRFRVLRWLPGIGHFRETCTAWRYALLAVEPVTHADAILYARRHRGAVAEKRRAQREQAKRDKARDSKRDTRRDSGTPGGSPTSSGSAGKGDTPAANTTGHTTRRRPASRRVVPLEDPKLAALIRAYPFTGDPPSYPALRDKDGPWGVGAGRAKKLRTAWTDARDNAKKEAQQQ